MCARLGELGEEMRRLERAGVDSLHIDVMDGHFVPNLTFGPDGISAVAEVTTLPLHAHLMVTTPEAYVARLADAGVHTFIFHIEATWHPIRLIDQISEAGMVPGIAVNPSTPLAFLPDVDVPLVLLMSVEPGFAGQRWLAATGRRLSEARSLLRDEVVLGVDGNVALDKVKLASRLGASLLVCGTSSLFGGSDYPQAVLKIRRASELGVPTGGPPSRLPAGSSAGTTGPKSLPAEQEAPETAS